jgi:hypothetical protein
MPLDIGRVTHLTDQMHRSEDDAGDPIDTGFLLAADGARGHVWTDPATIGGGGSLPWYNVQTDGTMVGDGSTDDTVAFQAAIDTATASGTQSANIYFPPGRYIIGGALQDTGARNAQILLPNVSSSAEQITIRFIGAARPPFERIGPIPTLDAGYAIIESTRTGGSGTAAVVSGGNQVFTSLNNIAVVVKDLVCFAPANPSLTWWNLMSTQGGAIDQVQVTVNPWTPTQPTHTNAYGIRLPQRGQSNYTYVDGASVGGFYTGIQLGELSIMKGGIFGLNIVAVELTSAPHPGLIISMHQSGCANGIKVVAGSFPVSFDVLQYNAEHYSSPSWAQTTYDLNDASNALNGHIRWLCADFSGPVDHIFNVNGGTNSSRAEMGPITPAPAFATPAIVLGTAAAAGSAATVIRSDGTIAAFDATVPTTSAIGDAAATGSVAKSARRDHVHGREALSTATPLVEAGSGSVGTGVTSSREDHVHPVSASGGIGPLLISDTPSTPLVFADLIQNEAQTDLVYADP